MSARYVQFLDRINVIYRLEPLVEERTVEDVLGREDKLPVLGLLVVVRLVWKLVQLQGGRRLCLFLPNCDKVFQLQAHVKISGNAADVANDRGLWLLWIQVVCETQVKLLNGRGLVQVDKVGDALLSVLIFRRRLLLLQLLCTILEVLRYLWNKFLFRRYLYYVVGVRRVVCRRGPEMLNNLQQLVAQLLLSAHRRIHVKYVLINELALLQSIVYLLVQLVKLRIS